ncbi:MAG: MaoC family dehydratase [Micropepsaceae bacterium]
MTSSPSAGGGNFFEDFRPGQVIEHWPARTLTDADQAIYTALFGARHAPQNSLVFAKALGLPARPLDDLLVFHIIFGKTVQDVSLNAIANLGYADCRFLVPVYSGDTLHARTEVIGVRENANRESGIVYVRSRGFNQHGEEVLTFARWVMVRKRTAAAEVPAATVPDLPKFVPSQSLQVAVSKGIGSELRGQSGGTRFFDDYKAGDRIDHADGVTVEESEHMMATRLYHNNARVHFNAHSERAGRFGKRIVYGGHVISIARAISFNGIENAYFVAGINAGRHVAPCFAGDTVYAWSEIVDKAPLGTNGNWGALRLRTLATKDQSCAGFPDKLPDGTFHPSVILEFDYWVVVPRG